MKGVQLAKNEIIEVIELKDIQNKRYDNTWNFIEDLKCFFNYCVNIQKKRDIRKAAKQFLTYAIEDLESTRICDECFNNAYTHGESSFIIPCKSPHLLLWVLWDGFGYWPAKVMSVDDENHTVNVRFFSDHKTGVLSENNCYLFSNERPDTDIDQSLSNKENLALYELAKVVSF